jgi:hypothetical protein
MAADSRIEFTAYCPPSVSEILATLFDYCIGRVDDDTVLWCWNNFSGRVDALKRDSARAMATTTADRGYI